MPSGRYLRLSTFLFVFAYACVHANFLYQFSIADESGEAGRIFTKYDEQNTDRLRVASRVYFTKASWMFILVLLQALGAAGIKAEQGRGRFDFFEAMAASTTIYAMELLYFFPFTIYIGLNCFGAGAMLITWLLNL